MDISEKNLEDTIEYALLHGRTAFSNEEMDTVRQPLATDGFSTAASDVSLKGYRSAKSFQYDKALCLIPGDVLDFIYATQPKEWDKFKKQYNNDARDKFFQRLDHELKGRGTLDVLRKGIKANGCKFQFAYFRPSSGLNETIQKLYEANLFTVIRQLHYSDEMKKNS